MNEIIDKGNTGILFNKNNLRISFYTLNGDILTYDMNFGQNHDFKQYDNGDIIINGGEKVIKNGSDDIKDRELVKNITSLNPKIFRYLGDKAHNNPDIFKIVLRKYVLYEDEYKKIQSILDSLTDLSDNDKMFELMGTIFKNCDSDQIVDIILCFYDLGIFVTPTIYREKLINYLKDNVITFEAFRLLCKATEVDTDIKIVEALIEKTPIMFSQLSDKFRNNPQILNIALKKFDINSSDNPDDEEFAFLQPLYKNPITFALSDAITSENKMLSKGKGRISFHDMESESKTKLLADRNFVLDYLENNCISCSDFNELSEELKNDQEIVKIVIKKSPYVFSELNQKFRDDPEILNIALKSYEYGSKEYYVSPYAEEDSYYSPASFALPNALDEDNIDVTIKKGYLDFSKIPEESKPKIFDKSFILKYLETNAMGSISFESLPKELQMDYDIVYSLIKQHPILYRNVDIRFRMDSNILKIALENYNKSEIKRGISNPILFAEPEALNEENIVLGSSVISELRLSFIINPAYAESRKNSIIKYPILVKYIPSNLFDVQMLIEALQVKPKIYRFLSNEQKDMVAPFIGNLSDDFTKESETSEIKKPGARK